jgi:hypothetical protein
VASIVVIKLTYMNTITNVVTSVKLKVVGWRR